MSDSKISNLDTLSIMAAIKNNQECGKLALEILNVMAYCDPHDFPAVILLGLIDYDISCVGLLDSSINLLMKHGMICYSGYTLSVDKLTQSNIRLVLKRQGMQEAVLSKAIDLLEAVIKKRVLDVRSHVECVSGYASEYRELDKKCEKIKFLNSKQKEEQSSLEVAAYNGNLKAVEFLIEYGTNIKDRNTPLIIAAQEGHLEIVEFLIRNGVGVDVKSKYGDTPLLLATFRGHIEVVKFLIKEKADINAKNKDGGLPIHVAAQEGHLEILEFLIKNGGDVNVKGRNDCTPLHLASFKGHLEIVKLLVENGADVNAIAKKNGNTPLDLAEENGYKEIVAYFKQLKL